MASHDETAGLEKRIQELEALLARQQRLATLGLITAEIAHEFNNLLTPMMGYARYALSAKSDQQLRDKALQKSLSTAERASSILQSLLNFARAPETATANIQKVLLEALTCLTRDLAKDAIQFSSQIDPELEVRMSAIQLEQVFLNLIINARTALLEKNAHGRSLTFRAQSLAQDVVMEFQDNGPGIPAEVLPQIFDPFFTTHRQNAPQEMTVGGTGLGLTICQRMIQEAGGRLEVTSQQGHGTCFRITLPAV